MFKGVKHTCFFFFFFALQNSNYISYLHYGDQAYKIMLTCSEELKSKTLGKSIIFTYCIEFQNRLTFPEIPLEDIIGKLKIA